MKKRFVLTLSILLIAITALSAAPTFSGRFRSGVTLSFGSNSFSSSVYKGFGTEGKLAINVADENGLWSINFKSVAGTLDSNNAVGAAATVDLTKALATKDINLPVNVSYVFGYNGESNPYSVYEDTFSTYDDGLGINNATLGVIVAYDKYVDVKGILDVTDSNNFTVTAKSAPVDGVSFALGWVRSVVDQSKSKTTISTYGKANGPQGTINVDIAKLASLDFKLGVSLYEFYDITDKANTFYGEIYGGYSDFDAFVEYMLNGKTSGLNIRVQYTGFTDTTIKITFKSENIADVKNEKSSIGAAFQYKLGGIKYNVEPTYRIDSNTFELTSYIDWNF